MIEFLYFILLIISVLNLIKRLKSESHIVSNIFFAVFIIYYILTPFILGVYRARMTTSFVAFKTPYLEVYSQASEKDRWRALLITIFVTGMLLALRHIKFVITNKNRTLKNSKKIGDNNNDYFYDFCSVDKSVYRVGVFFFVIGALSLLVLMRELGGLVRMLSLGSTIRGYLTNNAEYLSPLGAISKTLSSFITGSFFCLSVVWIKHKRHTILLIVSLILSVISLLFEAGRAPLLIFFGCIFFSLLKLKGKKIAWIVIIGFSIIALTSSSIEVMMDNISVGRPLLYRLEYNMVDNLLATVTDLAYPYANLLLLPKLTSIAGYSFGLDYLVFFSEIIPKRLLWFFWQNVPTPILVTTKISYYYISSGLSIGGTPADFISFGWFQGNIIGLVVNCLFFDWMLKKIDNILAPLPKEYTIIKYRMCFFAYSLITSNDLRLVIKNNLFLFIIMIAMEMKIRRVMQSC